MATIAKQSCPTCHQSVNIREITMYRGMITVLADIWRFIEKNQLWDIHGKVIISSRDVDKFYRNSNDRARFADLRYFAPELVGGKKGKYIFYRDALREFYAGKREITTVIHRDPLKGYDVSVQKGTIRDIPKLEEFMDENLEYVNQYYGHADLEQSELGI